MYYNARYYDPKLGRFVTADSIVGEPSNPQSLNRYSYVDNNPIKYTDPTGHKKKKKGFWSKFWRKALSAWVGMNVGVATFILSGGNLPLATAAGFATFRGMDAALNGASVKQTALAAVGGAVEGYLIGSGIQSGLSASSAGPPTAAKVSTFPIGEGKVGFELTNVSSMISPTPSKVGGIVERAIKLTLAVSENQSFQAVGGIVTGLSMAKWGIGLMTAGAATMNPFLVGAGIIMEVAGVATAATSVGSLLQSVADPKASFKISNSFFETAGRALNINQSASDVIEILEFLPGLISSGARTAMARAERFFEGAQAFESSRRSYPRVYKELSSHE